MVDIGERLKKVRSDNKVPDFGEPRIAYKQIENDQLIDVDGLSRREPLGQPCQPIRALNAL